LSMGWLLLLWQIENKGNYAMWLLLLGFFKICQLLLFCLWSLNEHIRKFSLTFWKREQEESIEVSQ
jgi:hypothetical protein